MSQAITHQQLLPIPVIKLISSQSTFDWAEPKMPQLLSN